MRAFLRASICLVACAFSACSQYPDTAIRVHNASASAFESVVVRFPEPQDQYAVVQNYGRLEPGKYSPYRSVTMAFKYAFVTVTTKEQTFQIRPIDYVGESILPPGRYTYQLTLGYTENGKPDLKVQLVTDQ